MFKLKQLVKNNAPWLVRLWRLVFRRQLFFVRNLMRLSSVCNRAGGPHEPWRIDFIYYGQYPKRLALSFKYLPNCTVRLFSVNDYQLKGDADFVCLVNGDAVVLKRFASALLAVFEEGEPFYADYFSRFYFPMLLPAWSPSYFDATSYCGSMLFVPVEQFEAYKGLDFEQVVKKLEPKHLPVPVYRQVASNPIPVNRSPVNRKSFTGLVSIIIPTRNGLNFLKPCVESVLANTSELNIEIIIVDNQSDDSETLKYMADVAKVSAVKILPFNQPFNFSTLNNFAAEKAHGDVLLFLNNDTEVISKDWLVQMLDQVQQDRVGCVGAKLLYPDSRVQHAGVVLGYGGGADHAFKFADQFDRGYMRRLETPQNYSAVTAACLMVRRDVFEQVGGFDESLQVAFNDVDLCLRVREGDYHNVWLPNVELFHFESPSRGADDTPEKQARFTQELNVLRTRWGKYIENDPAYSPWLARDRHDFAFAKSVDLQQALTLR